MKKLNENILNYEESLKLLKTYSENKIKFFVVYAHENKENKKLYFGQTSQLPERRWSNGNGYIKKENSKIKQLKFARAIIKYGWNNFNHYILNIYFNIDDSDSREKELIEKYNTMKYGYNTSPGGCKNFQLSEETKKKIGKQNFGEKNSFYGKHHTEEVKQKYLNRKIKCVETGEIFESIKDAAKKYNIRRTGITACCSGHQHFCGGYSWEYIGPMKIKKNFKKSVEKQKEAVSRKVICIETGEIFNSTKLAAEKYGLFNGSLISACCIGRKKTAKGYHWKYFNECSTTIESKSK